MRAMLNINIEHPLYGSFLESILKPPEYDFTDHLSKVPKQIHVDEAHSIRPIAPPITPVDQPPNQTA